jgi:hypothetical protein
VSKTVSKKTALIGAGLLALILFFRKGSGEPKDTQQDREPSDNVEYPYTEKRLLIQSKGDIWQGNAPLKIEFYKYWQYRIYDAPDKPPRIIYGLAGGREIIWEFGDGSNSLDILYPLNQAPTHYYTTNLERETFTVSLKITEGARVYTSMRNITVYGGT